MSDKNSIGGQYCRYVCSALNEFHFEAVSSAMRCWDRNNWNSNNDEYQRNWTYRFRRQVYDSNVSNIIENCWIFFLRTFWFYFTYVSIRRAASEGLYLRSCDLLFIAGYLARRPLNLLFSPLVPRSRYVYDAYIVVKKLK